jgi:predicted GH43/DUF377 family glycosyl hydrolase
MSLFKRDPSKPILSPVADHAWEAVASFNGSVAKDNELYHLVYRAISHEIEKDGHKLQMSVVGHATSKDGINFENRTPFIEPKEEWERFGCEDPRITKIEDKFVIFYTALSEYPPVAHGIRVAVAISDDMKTIKERHLVTPFNAKAMTLFPEKINGKYAAILTPHTDMPPSKICLALFDKLEDIWSADYWRTWYQNLESHVIPLQRMNSSQVEVGTIPLKTDKGWVCIFANIPNYYTEAFREFRIEAVLLDLEDPQKVISRVHEPLLEQETDYEKSGFVNKVVFPSGALLEKNIIYMYYGAADTHCCRAELPLEQLNYRMQITDAVPLKMEKFSGNPLLTPIASNSWEQRGVFNPASIYLNGTTYILYRAFSEDNTSTIGLATSSDGEHIDERLPEPIYIPRAPFESKPQSNVWSGCEDPRITQIGSTIYMLYTAYDGQNPPRVALTSILVDDFLKRDWKWTHPVLISPPGIDDKDACLLPEKVKGKYVIFHRIDNDIVLDFVDNLNFDGKNKFLRTLRYLPLREEAWDGEKVGIAAPPIKTQYGWMLLYHGVSKIDHEYRVGAMLLDLLDPSIVLAYLHYPILEPEAQFEREGLVPNVVFPCGCVLHEETLYIYYGGADKVICGAKVAFKKLMKALLERKTRKFLL